MIRPTHASDLPQPSPLTSLSASKQPETTESFAKSLALQDASNSLSVDKTKEAFQDFVGQTMFGQMLQSMRSTVGKPAYFHGGRGEEVFQQRLDQLLVEKISDASASTVADPMYELFRLQRSQ